MQNEKPQVFHFVLPSRRLSYEKLVQGESRTKRKAVQSERKGYKKRKSFYLPFPNCSRLYEKAAGFSFFLPSRSLTYEKVWCISFTFHYLCIL
ncbi:hypothetical protein MR642_01160 [bacterium]|nr:hypothetical protein [bacterium]